MGVRILPKGGPKKENTRLYSPVASSNLNKRRPFFPLSSPSFPLLRKRQYVRSKPLRLFKGGCTRFSIGLGSGSRPWSHPKYYLRQETWRFRFWRWFTWLVGRARSASFCSYLKYNYLSSLAMNVYSFLVQFCGFGYGNTSKQTKLIFLTLWLIGT